MVNAFNLLAVYTTYIQRFFHTTSEISFPVFLMCMLRHRSSIPVMHTARLPHQYRITLACSFSPFRVLCPVTGGTSKTSHCRFARVRFPRSGHAASAPSAGTFVPNVAPADTGAAGTQLSCCLCGAFVVDVSFMATEGEHRAAVTCWLQPLVPSSVLYFCLLRCTL